MSAQLQTTPGAGELAVKPPTKMERLKAAMKSPSIQEQMANALKDNKDAFIASMIDLVSGDTKLMECEPAALIGEALKAAVLKLPVIKSLGFAWIIPYQKSKQVNGQWVKFQVPQFQLGYKGYIQLAIRSGHYKYINARVVYEGQLVGEDFLTGHLEFQTAKSSDKVVGYMAHIQLHNGFSKTLFSTVDDITEHAKKYSKSYDPSKKDNIWVAEFDAMAMKTQLRDLLAKWGILSTEMQTAIDQDLAADNKSFVDSSGLVKAQDVNSESVGFDDAEVVGSNVTQELPAESEKETIPEGVEEKQAAATNPRQTNSTPPATQFVEKEDEGNTPGF